MPKLEKRPVPPVSGRSADSLIFDSADSFQCLTLAWTPHVDVCETPKAVVLRIEVPGVQASDLQVTLRNGEVIVSGVKREAGASRQLLCYYCVERRYGKFERRIRIEAVVDARRSRARLDKGILTIRVPKRQDRRGPAFRIPVRKA